MPPPVSGSTFPTLPYDVLVIVVSMLDRPTLKQARLCSRWLAKEALRHLFATVSLQMRAVDMERVIAIANCSTPANAVKELQLEQVPRLPKYTFEDWKLNARTSPDFNRIKVAGRFIRSDEWEGRNQRTASLPALTRQLFQEYEAQRKEPSLWIGLHGRGPSFSETILDSSTQNEDRRASDLLTWRQQMLRLQKACFDLENALLNLRNLQQLRVDHSVRMAVLDICWRGYYFEDPDFLGMDGFTEVAEDVAPIAFIFRILGKRNSSSDSLTSLRLQLDSEMWWGLQDVTDAWVPPEDSRYEDYEPNGLVHARRPNGMVTKNMRMAEEAFIHLTDIRIGFGPHNNTRELFEALTGYLSKAKKLERLELSTWDFDEMPEDNDMLSAMNDGARWPMLRHLKLDTYQFWEKSILRMISLVAPTLESLTLNMCSLLGEESSWSEFYDHMRLISFEALDHLHFSRGFQSAFHEELADGPCQTLPENDDDGLPVVHIMEEMLQYVIGYSPEIYDYILKRTDTKPPLQLFRVFDDIYEYDKFVS